MDSQEQVMTKLQQIHSLLIEAYDHYFERSDHAKMGEAVVTLIFPNYWEMKDGNFEPKVEIYSYALGKYRSHYFHNIDNALKCVVEWHKNEMSQKMFDSKDGLSFV